MSGFEVLGCVAAASLVLVLMAFVLVCLFMVGTASARLKELQETNGRLSKGLQDANDLLAKQPTPVTIHFTAQQIADLALGINNIRDSVNLPKEQVH